MTAPRTQFEQSEIDRGAKPCPKCGRLMRIKDDGFGRSWVCEQILGWMDGCGYTELIDVPIAGEVDR